MNSVNVQNKPFKSVHITNYYHKNSGGISNSYNRLLEAANRHERLVRLIVPGEISETEEVGKFGKIYYVKAKPFPLFDKRYRVMHAWDTYIFNGTPIREILKHEQPDMIEIAEKYSLSLLAGMIRKGRFKSLERPMLVHFTCERMDDNMESYVSDLKPFMWFARRVMGNYNFPMFDFHIANSDYTAQELLNAVSPAKNPKRSDKFLNFCWQYFHAGRNSIDSRVFVNPRGVNTTLYTDSRKTAEFRQTMLRECDFPENATVLLYAGRIAPEKNVQMLPELMKILAQNKSRDFRLIIAGDGPKYDWLKSEMEKLAPGKFKFLGHLTDREKLANLYANADIFVHPNPKEPFGIAPLEAMASGTPVVAPNSGGILTYANSENAWLVATNAESFAAAIQNVCDNDVNRAKVTRSALNTARTYTWESSTDKLFALYDKMYDEFQSHKELFAYETDPREIDFAKELFDKRREFRASTITDLIEKSS
ncbi:MAG: glycosyltransferase [Pyrinomonadaceae bacterium]|nr:glycosyltransferase [Pyrinomonadaceae bacterium]